MTDFRRITGTGFSARASVEAKFQTEGVNLISDARNTIWKCSGIREELACSRISATLRFPTVIDYVLLAYRVLVGG